jgi:AcrR family transcriptional regulator
MPKSANSIRDRSVRLHSRAEPTTAIRPATARERIDLAAYDLFSRRGVRAVGVDEIVERSGVAKMTLYRHYASKDHLVLSFLRRREELWTRAWLQTQVNRRATTPAGRLLAVFDVFDRWFRRLDFEGCSFINVLLEIAGRHHPVREATVGHLATIRAFLEQLARDAHIRHPESFARQWHILMKGAIVAACEGDCDAARRSRDLGQLLLLREGVKVDGKAAGGTRSRRVASTRRS